MGARFKTRHYFVVTICQFVVSLISVPLCPTWNTHNIKDFVTHVRDIRRTLCPQIVMLSTKHVTPISNENS